MVNVSTWMDVIESDDHIFPFALLVVTLKHYTCMSVCLKVCLAKATIIHTCISVVISPHSSSMTIFVGKCEVGFPFFLNPLPFFFSSTIVKIVSLF